MNFFVKTSNALSRNLAEASRIGKLLPIALAMALLAACAELPKRAPLPKTIIVNPKPPASAPVLAPAPSTVPISGVVLVAPANHEQEKNKIKLLLSKSSRDSLPVSEVGYYMDVLQGRVKQKIGKTQGVGMARSDDRIVIVMRGSSGFETGDAQISPGIRQFLAPLSKVLVEYRMTLVSIRIRADNSGLNNPQLTEQRSQAVARYLMEAGVSKKRMVVVSVGKRGAAPANPTSVNHARIELQLEPIVRAAAGQP